MRDTSGTKIKQSSGSRFSKENNIYGSIQEYFSDLSEIESISSGYTEEQFLDFLDVIDFILEIEKIEFNYKDINDLDLFLKELFTIVNGNNNYRSQIGSWNYDEINKVIHVNDPKIDTCQRVIYSLWIEPFYSLKNVIKKEVWEYVAYCLGKEYSRFEETEFGDHPVNYLIEQKEEDIHGLESIKKKTKNILDEIESYKEEVAYLNCFQSYIKEFSSIKYFKIDKSQLSPEELELIEIMDEINSFDYSLGVWFMDDMELDQEYFEKFIEDDTESVENLDKDYMRHEVCEKCYSGQYYLSMKENDDIETEYLQWINEAGNNCYWPVEFNAKITYSKNKREHQNLEVKEKMVKHCDNFFRFNEIIETWQKTLVLKP